MNKNIKTKLDFQQFFIYTYINYQNRLFISIIIRIVKKYKNTKIDINIFKPLVISLNLLKVGLTFELAK